MILRFIAKVQLHYTHFSHVFIFKIILISDIYTHKASQAYDSLVYHLGLGHPKIQDNPPSINLM